MGIYHKDCPRCATTVATYITRCDCGFSFDGNEDVDPAARLEALIEEERLYEEYWAARAKQAMAAAAEAEAAEAEAALFEEPALYLDKSSDVEKAIATRDAVLAELNQQKLRTAEILATIEAVKTGFRKVHVLKPHAHKSPEQKPLEPTPVVATAKAAAKPRVAASPVVLAPAVPPEPPVVADPPPANTHDVNAYTAKLEEILMGSKRNVVPEPVAKAVPLLLPAPPATKRAGDHRPSPNNTVSVSISKAADPVAPVTALSPGLSPEEELERAAKAVRSRATEMATRHGVVGAGITPPPDETARMTNPAAPVTAKPPKPEATTHADTPASPKKPAVPADTRPQMRAHHTRTAKTQRNKRSQHAVNTQVLTRAPSGPAPSPPTQEIAPPEPFISDRPSAVFRSAQAAKAEKIVQAVKASKSAGSNQCPYCSAMHPPETPRCGCGFLFEKSFDLPELVLNAKERAELLEGARPIKPLKPSG
ncbi:MAG: hypothetical protein HY942_02200 [Gammaproteobacteria bacterium]|nr:hypothetical protein [Gammaproteobacteria bacterium]